MAVFRVQRKVQAELDRMIGAERLPDFDDLSRLPYLRATLMETLRWMPVGPLGIPHTTPEDAVYEGYRILKGATVIAVSTTHISMLSSSFLISHLECLVSCSDFSRD